MSWCILTFTCFSICFCVDCVVIKTESSIIDIIFVLGVKPKSFNSFPFCVSQRPIKSINIKIIKINILPLSL